MDSPEGDRIVVTSSLASSPAVQESPFFNYLSSLSPIKSVKALRYTQRFLETSFPTPPPVFTSPHIDLQREATFLKRDNVDAAGSNVYGQCNFQLNSVLRPCFQKEVQTGSPPVCVNEYLADTVEGCLNSANRSVKINDEPQLLQNCFTGPEVAAKRVDDANDCNTDAGVLTLSDRTEEGLPLDSVELIEIKGHQRDDERFDDFLQFKSEGVRDHVESDVFLDAGFSAQHSEQNVAQNVKLQNAGDQYSKWDGSCQSLPESLQSVEAHQDWAESLRPLPNGFDKEANQHQRGIRRHLQFEAAMACKSPSQSHVEHRVSKSRQAISCAQNMTSRPSLYPSEFARCTENDKNIAISAPIPSGIGLHPNCIARSVSMGSDKTASKKSAGLPSLQEKLIPGRRDNLLKNLNGSASSISSLSSAHMDDNSKEIHAVVVGSTGMSQSPDSMKPPCNSLHVTPFEQEAVPLEGIMPASQNADFIAELNQGSPKRKRKKATCTSESEGCKGCNCKRSKCLKLYCECFAAGVYCMDSCACESCLNKPEYEDRVLETRQQIESRNPLAFAPKIVKLVTDSPANIVEDRSWKTPSSARHKRGCNCRKSKCLKKYCECYQAEVGCSDGCRCEGCNNSFGKKPESIYQRAERWKYPSQEKLETQELPTGCTKAGTATLFSPTWEELADMSHLTPLSQPHSGAVASSASPNVNISRNQLQKESSLQSSASHLHCHASSSSLIPQLCENKAPHYLSSDSPLYCIIDNDTPEILKDSYTPTKAVKASSPNKKRVSPPQLGSRGLRSSNSPGLRSGRKFVLLAVPSFPPLTPYSNSKDGVNQIESHHQSRTSIQ